MNKYIFVLSLTYFCNKLNSRHTSVLVKRNLELFIQIACALVFVGSTGAAGPRLFTIHAVDAPSENLPKAHTCFNRIDIPQSYPNYKKMLDKLTQAVEETCGFAVE